MEKQQTIHFPMCAQLHQAFMLAIHGVFTSTTH
jgi:hypothetical protein